MKITPIEIAETIELAFKSAIAELADGYEMRFTRFIDLGGSQMDLYAYAAIQGAPPWMIVRLKSVESSDQGFCIQYFVELMNSKKAMDEVLVGPKLDDLSAVCEKIVAFAKEDMQAAIDDEGKALEGAPSGALPESSEPENPSDEPEADGAEEKAE